MGSGVGGALITRNKFHFSNTPLRIRTERMGRAKAGGKKESKWERKAREEDEDGLDQVHEALNYHAVAPW